MPEAVKTFIATNDAVKVREVQKEILLAYDKDISKHAPANEAVRINQVWKSIPAQLAKENRKFIYGVVRSGARAKDYEVALQWLLDVIVDSRGDIGSDGNGGLRLENVTAMQISRRSNCICSTADSLEL